MNKAIVLNKLGKALERFSMIDVLIAKYQSDNILIPGLAQFSQTAGRVQQRSVHRGWT